MAQAYDFNQIIMDPKGNTYEGGLACSFAYKTDLRDKLEAMFNLKLFENSAHPCGQFWVIEVMADGELITRAGQSKHSQCYKYMAPNRIIVWHSALWNGLDARNPVCKIA